MANDMKLVVKEGKVDLRIVDASGDYAVVLHGNPNPIAQEDLFDPAIIKDRTRREAADKRAFDNGSKYDGKLHTPVKTEDFTVDPTATEIPGKSFADILKNAKADKQLSSKDRLNDSKFMAVQERLLEAWIQLDPQAAKTFTAGTDGSLLAVLRGKEDILAVPELLAAMSNTFDNYYGAKGKVVEKEDIVDNKQDVAFERVSLRKPAKTAEGVLVTYEYAGKQVFSIREVNEDGSLGAWVANKKGATMFDKRHLDDLNVIEKNHGKINLLNPHEAFAHKGKDFAYDFGDAFRAEFYAPGAEAKLKDKLADDIGKKTVGTGAGVKFSSSDAVLVHKIDEDTVFLSVQDDKDRTKRNYFRVKKVGDHFTEVVSATHADVIAEDKNLQAMSGVNQEKALNTGKWGGAESVKLNAYIGKMGEREGVEFVKAVQSHKTIKTGLPKELDFSATNTLDLPGHWNSDYVYSQLIDKKFHVDYIENAKSTPASTPSSQPDDGRLGRIEQLVEQQAKSAKDLEGTVNSLAGKISSAAKSAGVDSGTANELGASAAGGLETGKSFLANIFGKDNKWGVPLIAALGGVGGMAAMQAVGQGERGLLGGIIGAVLGIAIAHGIRNAGKDAVDKGANKHATTLLEQRAADRAAEAAMLSTP